MLAVAAGLAAPALHAAEAPPPEGIPQAPQNTSRQTTREPADSQAARLQRQVRELEQALAVSRQTTRGPADAQVARLQRRLREQEQAPVRQGPPGREAVEQMPLRQDQADPTSASEVLRGTHNGRVARIVLSTTGSSNADGVLTVEIAFQVDVAARGDGAAPAPAPLRIRASSADGGITGLSFDSPAATVSESAAGVVANGTARVHIQVQATDRVSARPPRYDLKIVDPMSGTESNTITVNGPESAASPWGAGGRSLSWQILQLLAALIALLAAGWALRRRLRGASAAAAETKAERPPSMADVAAETAPPPPPAYLESTEVPEVPPVLLAAIEEGRGVLSIGTGVAGQAGLPTGTELMRMLIAHFGTELPDTFADEAGRQGAPGYASSLTAGPLSRAMDVLLSRVPRDVIAKEIRDALHVPPRDPSFHRLAVAPAWRAMLSLAWDDLAYRAAVESGTRGWQRLRPDDQFPFTEALRDPRPYHFDVVGQLDFPVSLSLSMDELRRNLARNPEWQRGLTLLMQSHALLFVGTEPDVLEQFFQTIFLEGGTAEPRHFALAPMGPDTEFWKHSLARFGVGLLPYGPAQGHRAVREFMARLSDQSSSPAEGAPSPTVRATPQIGAISLRNIGPFESLDLTLATEPVAGESARPWTVIFGTNGMGKSTVLRAAALALVGTDEQNPSTGARLLRAGAKEGTIELKMGSESLRTSLFRDGSGVIVQPAQVTPVQAGYALVLGFPSLRGAPTRNPEGVSKQVDKRMPEAGDLLPLLHGSVDDRLGNFKQWLLNILVQASQDPGAATEENRRKIVRAGAQRDLLDLIIREIVPGDIDGLLPVSSDFTLMVRTADGPVPFDSMSQGMASIFNWLGVLVQRLYQAFPDIEKPEQEEATVIVDEIDAHLHPDWQRRLVTLTKQHFPKVQVIATSHSPLLAGALHVQELCVLEREPESGQIAPLADVPDLFGQRSHDILISAAFGLETDRNPHAEAQIREYFALYEKLEPTDSERERMAVLKAQMDSLRYGEPQHRPGAPPPPPPPPLQSAQVEPASAAEAERLQATLAALKMGPSEAPGGETR